MSILRHNPELLTDLLDLAGSSTPEVAAVHQVHFTAFNEGSSDAPDIDVNELACGGTDLPIQKYSAIWQAKTKLEEVYTERRDRKLNWIFRVLFVGCGVAVWQPVLDDDKDYLGEIINGIVRLPDRIAKWRAAPPEPGDKGKGKGKGAGKGKGIPMKGKGKAKGAMTNM